MMFTKMLTLLNLNLLIWASESSGKESLNFLSKTQVHFQVYTQKLVRSDKYKTGKDNKYVEKNVIFEDNRNILIGRIPVMVKS